MNIFVLGSSIVSSYWNGDATCYRGGYKYLARRGHRIMFAESDAYGRQQQRDAHDCHACARRTAEAETAFRNCLDRRHSPLSHPAFAETTLTGGVR